VAWRGRGVDDDDAADDVDDADDAADAATTSASASVRRCQGLGGLRGGGREKSRGSSRKSDAGDDDDTANSRMRWNMVAVSGDTVMAHVSHCGGFSNCLPSSISSSYAWRTNLSICRASERSTVSTTRAPHAHTLRERAYR